MDSEKEQLRRKDELASKPVAKTVHTPMVKFLLSVVVCLQIIGSWYLIRFSLDHLKEVPGPFEYETIKEVYLGALEENLSDKWSYKYSRTQQLAGTDMEMVEWARSQFEKFGFNATIDEYKSLVSYPLNTSVSLFANGTSVYTPKLQEDEVKADPASSNPVPAFLGYAANGNVTAQYVYCNYGTPDDFKYLDTLGVNVTGKIAIVRYGAIYRGLKIKNAQENGAVGVLIYSDPVDDGDITEANGYKAYPDGPARNPSTIQRGSGLFLSQGPGDPYSPGFGRKPGQNYTLADPYKYIPSIPALPVSPKEITPILKQLSGHGPKTNWTKGLIKGFDYSVGPNPDYEVNVYNHQKFEDATMHNIMAKIEGHNPHEVVLIGNHHDAWIPTSGDPHSGSVVVMELARALGELVKLGWKPARTILLGSWDGEEYGLLGSTEFGEYWAGKLRATVVAYLNLDVSVIGPNFQMSATPSLFDVLSNTTAEIDTGNGTTLEDNWLNTTSGHFGTLGSGSDWTVFLDHLGIPSVDFGFWPNKTSAIYPYHSVYDSYTWMTKFGDPGFVHHNEMAKMLGLTALHLADDKVIPLRLRQYPLEIKGFFDKIVDQMPEDWANATIKPTCSAKTKKVTVSELIEDISVKLDELADKCAEDDAGYAVLQDEYDHWDDLSYWQKLLLLVKIKRANFKLKYYERHFVSEEGLKSRPFFKHFIYASGRYTGYASQQLPFLQEPLEDGKKKQFAKGLVHFDKLLTNLI